MPEEQKPKAKPDKKGPIGKLKDIAEDKEEQLQIIGAVSYTHLRAHET